MVQRCTLCYFAVVDVFSVKSLFAEYLLVTEFSVLDRVVHKQ